MSEISRRSFLQTATLAGVAVGSVVPLSASGKGKEGPISPKLPVVVCSRGEYWGRRVNEPAWKILSSGGSVLDAVIKGANVVELDPEDQSVGYGGRPNEDGVVELDASVMYGPTHNCGSVAALRHIKTPSSVARLVMERTDHMMLVGKGALRFALAHGFKKEKLLTEASRIAWLEWKENLSDQDDWFPPPDGKYTEGDRPTGTINVLAVDANGDIAGVTTTSGLAYKIPGRVGDSPIIGAGLYVDNDVGAAGATGRGEEVMRTLGSFYVVSLMREGKTPQEACELACKRIIDINKRNGHPIDFNDKFVAVRKDGQVGVASVRGSKDWVPELALWNADGFRVVKGTYLIEAR